MLTGGVGTLSETPIGNVNVIKADGSIVTVTPSGSNITVPAGGDTKVTAIYRYSDTVDRVSISTTEPPKIVTVILLAEVRDSSNTLVEELQIEVPRVQIDGNYELSLSADGVSNETLSGKALKVDGNTCSDGDTYGYVSWVPKTSVAPTIVDIAGSPSSIDVSASGTLPSATQITVFGLRGGMFTPLTLTSGLTFTKKAGGDADITVNATGLVTVASGATNNDTADILVTYTDGVNTFKDTVTVTIVA